MEPLEQTRMRTEDYRILRELGMGSYGSVHLALHVTSDTKCVIKKIKISHMTSKELEEARREVKVLSSLSHPYITLFRDSCEEEGFLLIAMDYCGGGDLHTLITNRSGIYFPEDRILDWFVQLCLAMKYIHDRKILHRDIKAQNIFLTDDGKVRLGDFGIAKILNSTSDLARTCIGTPYYLSPEMCENKPYNNKSDIWALGCVLYEMITLKHAFEANNMKALILKIIKGIYHPIPARYSRDLRLLLTQIFQREPQARPSISAILRKPFIFKRVSRFISGCEEEELRASLIKRKCPIPASARRIPVVKRPSDITDPAAKYGVSQSFSKKPTHRSPKKPVSRVAKQTNGGARVPAGVAHTRVGKLSEASRKKYQSEHNLLADQGAQAKPETGNEKRFQRRSKSVPHAFKQNNFKSQQQTVQKKSPSSVKLQMMLDSAGFKKADQLNPGKNKLKENITKASKLIERPHQSPKIQGWFVDATLADAHNPTCKNSNLVEDTVLHNENELTSTTSITRAKSEPQSGDAVLKQVYKQKTVTEPCADDDSEPRVEPLSISVACNSEVECNKADQLQKRNSSHSDVTAETSQKEAKDLANKSLKEQSESCSEDDNDESVDVAAGVLRQQMHKKLRKVMAERTHRMSQMVSERRQWAYQREKLESSVGKSKEETVVLETVSDCSRGETLLLENVDAGSERCTVIKHTSREGMVQLGGTNKDSLNCTSTGNKNCDAHQQQLPSETKDEDQVQRQDSKFDLTPGNCTSKRQGELISYEISTECTSTCRSDPADTLPENANDTIHSVQKKLIKDLSNAKIVEDAPAAPSEHMLKEKSSSQGTTESHEVETFCNSFISTVRERIKPVTSPEKSSHNELKETQKHSIHVQETHTSAQFGICEISSRRSDTSILQVPSEINGRNRGKKKRNKAEETHEKVNAEDGVACTNSTETSVVTPSKRARWGAVHTAGLDKSPLETSGSEMESTTSEDMVIVYKEFGERKQWDKQGQDILNVLSEAQITDRPVNQKVERKEQEKFVKNSGKVTCTVEVSNTPSALDSTFTVDLRSDQEGCGSGSSKANINSSHSTSAAENKNLAVRNPTVVAQPVMDSTYTIQASNHSENNYISNDAHQKFTTGSSNVDETICVPCSETTNFDQTVVLKSNSSTSNNCDDEKQGVKDLSSTFTIANANSITSSVIVKADSSAYPIQASNHSEHNDIPNDAHQKFTTGSSNVDETICVPCSETTNFGQTVVLKSISSTSNTCDNEKQAVKDLSSTFTVANAKSNTSSVIVKAVSSASDGRDVTFNDVSTTDNKTNYLDSVEGSNSQKKLRGGLLEKFRYHMSPQPKKKYQTLTNVDSVAPGLRPSASEEKLTKKTAGSDLVMPKEEKTPSRKKGRIKSGIAGILRKLSSKHDVKTVESQHSFEKDSIPGRESTKKSKSESGSLSDIVVGKTNAEVGNPVKNSVSSHTSKSESIVASNENLTYDTDKDVENTEVDIMAGIEYLSQHAQRMKELEIKHTSGNKDKTSETYSKTSDGDVTGSRDNVQSSKVSGSSKCVSEKNDSEPIGESTQTSDTVRAGEVLSNERINMAKDIEEVHAKLLDSKSEYLPVIQFDKESIDSGIDTQRTNLTCQTDDSFFSDTQSSLSCSSVKLNQMFIAQDTSNDIDASESKTALGGANLTHSTNNSQKYMVPLPEGIQVHPPIPETHPRDCIQDLAYSIFEDVFEKAKLKVSEMNTTSKGRLDISPISTSNILINMNCSGELTKQDLPNQLESENNTLKVPVQSLQSYTKSNNKELDVDIPEDTPQTSISRSNCVPSSEGIRSDNESPTPVTICDNFGKPDQSPNHTYSDLNIAHSPARARPTVLHFCSSDNDRFIKNPTSYPSSKAVQNEEMRKGLKHSNKQQRVSSESKELSRNVCKSKTQCEWENEAIVDETGAAHQIVIHPRFSQRDDTNTASDEESEDLANLRQSMELLLTSGEQFKDDDSRAVFSSCSTGVWHLDRDGAVVSGGGGVYSWIEEQRAKLEDILGLELFIKAYHHLDEAQERDGCVVGDAVSQVEEMLGPDHHHLAYDVLQLVVAEAVYHD